MSKSIEGSTPMHPADPRPGKGHVLMSASALVLIAAGISRLVYFLVFASFQDLKGDERHYFDGAVYVINLATRIVAGLDTEQTVASILSRGWFMPGMSILLAPVRLMTSSVAVARLYIGCLNFALLVGLVTLVRQQYGKRSALVTASLLGFFPGMIIFSFTFWGGSLAGQLIVVVLLLLTTTKRSPLEGPHLWRRPLLVGILVLVVVYLRPGYIVMLPIAAVILVLLHLHFETSVSLAVRRSTVAIALLTAVVLIGLAPWSYALSKDKGGLFLTTTTIELNTIIRFGRREDVNAVHPEIHLRVRAWDKWITERSEKTGESYADILSNERRRILSSVDFAMYRQVVRRQLRQFYLRENDFFDRMVDRMVSSPHASTIGRSEAFSSTIRAVNSVAWRLLLLSGLMLLLAPLSCKRENWWAALNFKITFLALSIQPFVSIAHGRYYIALVPLLIVTVSVVTNGRPRAIPFLWQDRVQDWTLAEKVVGLLQVATSAIVVSVVFLIRVC